MRISILSILFFLYFSTHAQFSDSVTHYLKFVSTGVINRTNTSNSYVLSNGVNFNTIKKNVSLNTAAGWVYGSSQDALTNNDLALHADLNFFKPAKKLSYWVLGNFDKSYSLKINYRLQAGAGISYNFISNDSLRINISDGFLYENGDITDVAGAQKKYSTPRNSFRLLYRWNIKDRVSISGIHFYQPSLSDIDDYVIQSTNNLSVKLYKWLSLTASLLYNKVTITNRENLLITYGLILEKYF